MLPEELEDHCAAAVMMRGRAIAAKADVMMFSLTYETDSEGNLATIRGKVHGSSSPGSVYRVWVSFDPHTEEYDDGACTCPAYTGYRYDVCKHMAALVLHFADHPNRFAGFEGAAAAGSSMDLLDYMRRMDEAEELRRRARHEALLRESGVDPADDGGRDGSGRGGTLAERTGTFGVGRSSSRSSARAAAPSAMPASMAAPGKVGIEPALSHTGSSSGSAWSVSFRIVNRVNGASYVLKSVSRFVLNMRCGEYEQYGVRLAFTHTPDMLDDHGRAMLRFMRRVADTRAVALRAARYYSAPVIERDMALTDDEVVQLLHASEGRRIGLAFDPWDRAEGTPTAVEAGEQPIRITMRRARQGATSGYALHGNVAVEALIEGADRTYLLVGPAPEHTAAAETSDEAPRTGAQTARALSSMGIGAIADLSDDDLVRLGLLAPGADADAASKGSADAGSRTGALHRPGEHRWFCRLPESCAPVRPVIASLCDGDPEGRFVADDDLPLFARTLLPMLREAGLDGDIPDDVRQLQPLPCEPEFYLDRNENGVTCMLRARYGAREVGIIPFVPADRGGSHDFAAERIAEQMVRRYFAVDDTRHPGRIDRDDTHALVRLFDEGLAVLRHAGKVFTTPAFDRLLAPRPPKVRLGAAMNGGLVEVSVLADEVPPDEVGALLASYRRRQRFHRLRDGTLVPLAARDEGMDALADVARDLGLDADAFDRGDGRVTIPGFQAFLVDGEVDDADKDASFARYVNDLRVIDPNRYAVPDALAGVLRPYQVTGYRWLQTLWDKGFGGILADEMGLGKSVQFIALLLARHACGQVGSPGAPASTAGERAVDKSGAPAPALIVCPASLVYNWTAEFAKFAPELDVRAVAGSKADRRALLAAIRKAQDAGSARAGDDGADGDSSRSSDTSDTAPAAGTAAAPCPDVIVTSYDLLRLDADDYRGITFCAMALDEAQAIKNHATKVARAVKTVDARHRFALTGTPVENRLAELWSIFDYLMPGLLGGFKRFHERYELPISSDAYGDEGRAQAAKLKALVGVFILRRLKSQVLTDLPDKLENVITVQLEGEQRRLYAAHEQRLKATLTHTDVREFNAERIRILAELTRLRQICCDPRLLYANAKDRSAKLAAIDELVGTCIDEGKKVLVFSQFTSFLDLIGERLRAHDVPYYVITGSTPKKRRVELVDRFNADAVPVFLISLKAGNTGLNLTGASVVIHADPWWNAAAQDQATDRAHRIGQTRDVNVYQIVAKDTVEERMLRLQRTKSEIARQVVGGSGGAAGIGGAGAVGVAGTVGTVGPGATAADSVGATSAGTNAPDGAAAITGLASLTKNELLGLLSA
ncbi:helicase [Bifidobacterium sp. DSM 109958]|uniref:Helicase n=1 Tax=Bifidobacterium moraviense TaxID=2675323 RepID=A0A7Y0HZD5_9BIFI|nr:helicase [Bifidobacterium sp. DSM 109958]